MFVDRVLKHRNQWGMAKRISESQIFFFNNKATELYMASNKHETFDKLTSLEVLPADITIALRDMVVFYRLDVDEAVPNETRIRITPLPSISKADMKTYIEYEADTYITVYVDHNGLLSKVSITRAQRGKGQSKGLDSDADMSQYIYNLMLLQGLVDALTVHEYTCMNYDVIRMVNSKNKEKLNNRPMCAHSAFKGGNGEPITINAVRWENNADAS